MAGRNDETSEEFIRMIQVLADNEDLLKWFFSLRFIADNVRYSMLGTMVEEMKANREDPELVAAIRSLMDPVVYAAAAKTIEKMRE